MHITLDRAQNIQFDKFYLPTT